MMILRTMKRMRMSCIRLLRNVLMHHKGSGGITDRGVPRVFHLVGLCVVKELEIHAETIGTTVFHLCHHVEEHSDGVTTTYCVPKLLQVTCEAWSVQSFDEIHTLFVQNLNRLVYITTGLVVVGVPEPLAPVAEVRRYHKTYGRILEVLSKYLAIFGLGICRKAPYHDRDNVEATPHHLHDLGNVRKLHLDAVLILVSFDSHHLKMPGIKEFPIYIRIDPEIIQRSLVGGVLGHRTPGQSHVVGRTKDEDCPDNVRVDLLEAVCCSGSAVSVASMRADHGPCRGGL